MRSFRKILAFSVPHQRVKSSDVWIYLSVLDIQQHPASGQGDAAASSTSTFGKEHDSATAASFRVEINLLARYISL